MSLNRGAGNCGCGSSSAGFGTPYRLDSTAAQIFIKQDGSQGNIELIEDGDYVLNDTGINVGDDSTHHSVMFALTTLRDSSAVRNFGVGPFPKVVGGSTEREIIASVELALKHLTDSRSITLLNVSFSRFGSTSGQIVVTWQNQNGESQNFLFNP